MRIIKALNDIKLLKEKSTVSKKILNEMEEHFKNIHENIGKSDGIDINEFSLQDYGIIVYLEAGDNVRDLEEIGLNPEEGGLIGAVPEWIDEKPLKDGTLVTACILYNNEYAISIFFKSNDFDEEVQNWVSDNI